jgi:hypothetical protein
VTGVAWHASIRAASPAPSRRSVTAEVGLGDGGTVLRQLGLITAA